MNYVLCHVDPFNHKIYPFAILRFPVAIHFELSNTQDATTFFYKLANILHKKYPDVFPSYFDEYSRKREYWYNLYCDIQKRVILRLREQIKKEIQEFYKSKRALQQAIKERINEMLEDLPVYEF
jgi:hypothetical protein